MTEHKYGLSPKETGVDPKVMHDLAMWWGDRPVASGEEIRKLPFYKNIAGPYGLNHGHYILVTRHANDPAEKAGILELGGVIGVPDRFSIGYCKMASDQIRFALGEKVNGIGAHRDGLTFVYLHAAGPELNDLCRDYVSAISAGDLAKAFGDPAKLDHKRFRFQLENIIQAPWETLSVGLTEGEGPEKLKRILRGKNENINFNLPGFQYKLRIVENKYLQAII